MGGVGWGAEPMDPGKKRSKARCPGERKLQIWAPGPLDKGKKCHQPEPRAEGDGSWTGLGPPLKMASPSPEPPDRPYPASPSSQRGCECAHVCAHVCVRVCLCFCPFKGESMAGATVESRPAGVAGILSNPGGGGRGVRDRDSTATSKRETTRPRKGDTYKWDPSGAGSGKKSGNGGQCFCLTRKNPDDRAARLSPRGLFRREPLPHLWDPVNILKL